LRLFNISLPLVLAAMSFAIMLGYPLDEAEQKRLRADIEQRRAAAIPATPDTAITGEALAEGPAE
jgi:Na+/melibiose symporter-like transporter